jgi:hypothetical protein
MNGTILYLTTDYNPVAREESPHSMTMSAGSDFNSGLAMLPYPMTA